MRSKKPGKNIQEFHHGARYAKMKRKFGKKKADQIAVAAGMSAARRSKRKHG